MIYQEMPVVRRQIPPSVALISLLLTVILAPSVLGAAKARLTNLPESSVVSRSPLPIVANTQDSNVYTIKEAGLQFEVPKGWKAEVDKDSNNVILTVADGALTVTFVVEDKYADVVTGMKAGLKEKLTEVKSEGEQKEDKHNGMVHLAESGSGMLKDTPIGWSIDVLKATKNVTILTFGVQKVMEAHGEEYGKFVLSIKKI
jgi:hypothetical protein